MTKIWKFGIEDKGIGQYYINCPTETELLSCGVQNDEIIIWGIVKKEGDLIQKKIVILGTGWEATEFISGSTFLGTAKLSNGLVFHIFQ